MSNHIRQLRGVLRYEIEVEDRFAQCTPQHVQDIIWKASLNDHNGHTDEKPRLPFRIVSVHTEIHGLGNVEVAS